MSSRAARLVALAIENQNVEDNQIVSDRVSPINIVNLSNLEPLTTYEYIISNEGVLLNHELTVLKPVSMKDSDILSKVIPTQLEPVSIHGSRSDKGILKNLDLDDLEQVGLHRSMCTEKSLEDMEQISDLGAIELDSDVSNLIKENLSETQNFAKLEPVSFNTEILRENEVQKSINFLECEPRQVSKEKQIVQKELSEELVNKVSEGNTTQNSEELNIIQRKRKIIAGPEEWDRNKNKKLRMSGKKYIGFTRNKNGEVEHNIKRAARKLGPPCMCHSKYNCGQFSEENREDIFRRFWTLTWDQKKMYVRSLARYMEKKRSYTHGPSRRTGTILYYLQIGSDKLPVCKRMFMSSLGIGEKMIRNWLTEPVEHGMPLCKSEKVKTMKQKEDAGKIEFLKDVIEKLPKLPSHYCRKNTNKIYFEEQFKNKTEIYNVYKNECIKNDTEAVSIFSFSRILETLNVAIHHPKKDQCDLCCSYKVGQVEEKVYKRHLLNKDRARAEKDNDKILAIEKKCYTVTMDVQAVHLCPVLFASKLYFKSKLQVHNFTVYDIETHKCENYCWNETEGELGSSTFATCILDYLRKYCLEERRSSIIIYSDNCGYQNKNVALSNALLSFAVRNHVTIFQKYLEKGHTQMECDSTHALIERKLKNREIHIPSQYSVIIKEARRKPFPLDIQYLTYDFFMKYDEKTLYTYPSIRPGRNTNDPKVNDVKVFKYSPEGKIFFKLNYDDEYVELPCRTNTKNIDALPISRLYDDRIKISRRKYNDLQDLISVLPPEVKQFYSDIPHVGEDISAENRHIEKIPKKRSSVAIVAKKQKKSLKRGSVNKKSEKK